MKNIMLIFILLIGFLSSQITFAIAEKPYQQDNNITNFGNKHKKNSFLEKRLLKKIYKITKIKQGNYGNYDAIGAFLVVAITIFTILAGIILFGIPLVLLGVNFWLASFIGILLVYLFLRLLIH